MDPKEYVFEYDDDYYEIDSREWIEDYEEWTDLGGEC